MTAATVPVHEFMLDGSVVGCGTAAELAHWTAQGTMDGYVLGAEIAREPASEDTRRAALWARAA